MMDQHRTKKILILAEHFAPAYKAGGIVRSLENLVKGLDGKYNFEIITSNSNLQKTETLENIEYNRWMNFTGKSRIIYLSAACKTLVFLKHSIHSIRPTNIYINGMFSPFFTVMPLLIAKLFYSQTTVIIAPRGMLHKGNLQQKWFKKKIFFFLFDLFGLHKKIRWHATDNQEVEDIHAMFGKQADVVLAAPFSNDAIPALNLIEKSKGQLRLATVALIAQKKGHLELIKALKSLQCKLSIELHLYGPVKDIEVWESCKKEIRTLSDNIRVVYHGFVSPDQICSSLLKCHFFILLSSGENFCHAAYESLKAGRPLIISDQTPWRNLAKQKAGWDISLINKKVLLEVLRQANEMDQPTYNEYCIGAQNVAKHYLRNANFRRQYCRLFK